MYVVYLFGEFPFIRKIYKKLHYSLCSLEITYCSKLKTRYKLTSPPWRKKLIKSYLISIPKLNQTEFDKFFRSRHTHDRRHPSQCFRLLMPLFYFSRSRMSFIIFI